MKKTDNLFTGEKARQKLMAGINKASKVVGATMGTAGSNALIECFERPNHFCTNDGETILKSMKFQDPLEEMGRMILYESVSRANKSSGDGSSTTCVLTNAILEEGMKYIGEYSPMDIKRSLEECIPIIEKSINDQKKEITVDEVGQVAMISAEDEEIGNRIQEIYQKIGKDGIISWDISKTAEDSYTLGTGLTISGATYASPYMCDPGTNEVRMDNAYILLTRKKITSALEFEKLFSSLYQQGTKEICVFCEDIDVPAIIDLLQTQRIRGFKTIVIKMPVLWKDEWYEDLALASGATVIDIASGLKLEDITLNHLGKFGHIVVTKDDTYIDGINDMLAHICNLKAKGDDDSLIRVARLNTKTARYFVGAQSETALAYRRLKVEDSINAASCALENGVVAGGGIALTDVIDKLPKTVGGNILKKSLKYPFKQIIENAGIKDNFLYGNGNGFNTKTMEPENMFEAGIVDPADVVINAVKSSVGVAAAILTINSVITLNKDVQ